MPRVITRGVALIVRRVSWGLGDQAVSSITNFTVGVVVARSLGAVEFGIFSLAWVTYTLVLNVARGLATDPLVVRHSGEPDGAWRAAVGRASGTSLTVGIVAGIMAVGAGVTVGGSLGGAFVALGVVLPLLLLQDSWRFAFFAGGRGERALVNDAIWGIALIPALFIAAEHGSVFAFVLAWGAAGSVAAVIGSVQARVLPWPPGVTTWLRTHRDLGPRYLVENLCQSGAAQLRMYGLGAVAGLAAVGTVRGGELLVGPFLAVLMGLNLVAVPEASRVAASALHRLPVFCLLLGGVQWAAALCWGLGLLFVLPDAVGVYLLGAVWPTAAMLIVPATLSVMNAGLSAGASAGLRALGAARLSLRTQLIASTAYAGFGIAGAAVAGAVGSSWGVAAATLLGTILWWVHLRVALRRHIAAAAAADTESFTAVGHDDPTIPIDAVFTDTEANPRPAIEPATVVPPAVSRQEVRTP